MAEVIIMPKLGFNMDEGQLVKWHKNVGDHVTKGEVIFEINTDKTNIAIDATTDGVVLKIMLEEGEYAPVFTPIAVIGEEGEDAETVLAKESSKQSSSISDKEQEEEAIQETTEEKMDTEEIKLTPKAKKYIKDQNIDLKDIKQIQGTGFEGGITAKDIKASPLAKKIARKADVDLSTVKGTGAGGKIMKADVEESISKKEEKKAVSISNEDKKILKETPYKGIRKIIGDRLSESKFTAPHLYFSESVDTTNLTVFRKELNNTSEVKVAVSDLLILAASKALQKYPEMNSSLIDDKVITYKSTNVGIAVAGENGLIVPVVKNAQEKSLTMIAEETRDLVERAKDGKLAAEEYSNGTFTISNLGMFGIENFTAIINPPESAILSISSVRKKPVIIEENEEDIIVIRPMMNIQLSVDHRIIDGLLAAQFVGYIKRLLEDPIKILI